MAGKVKVNGTIYTINGGKTKISGTNKTITGGKTKINGTNKSIVFDRKLFLYKDGNEYTSVTGGWNITGYTSPDRTLKLGTKNANNIYLAGSNSTMFCIAPVNIINFTSYTKLRVQGHMNGILSSPKLGITLRILNSKNIEDQYLNKNFNEVGDFDYTYNLTNVAQKYIFFNAELAPNIKGYIYKVWLE